MVNSPTHTRETDFDPVPAVAALKRRIVALEEENAQLSNKLIRTPYLHHFSKSDRTADLPTASTRGFGRAMQSNVLFALQILLRILSQSTIGD